MQEVPVLRVLTLALPVAEGCALVHLATPDRPARTLSGRPFRSEAADTLAWGVRAP